MGIRRVIHTSPDQVEALPALVLIIRRGKAVLIYGARSQEEEAALRDLAHDLGPILTQLQMAIERLNHWREAFRCFGLSARCSV